jgi:D-aspartate ligase
VTTAITDTECPSETHALAEELPPALVFGRGLTLLGVMRQLGRAGIPLYVVGTEKGFHTRSRWYRSLGEYPLRTEPHTLAPFLRQLPLPGAVLVPCADDWAQAVSNLPRNLQDRFLSVTPASAVVETMVDKWRFAEFLRRTEIPHPRTELIADRAEAEILPRSEWQGKILKPLNSVEFSHKHGVKGFLVNSVDEALAALRKVDFPIMLQEYIPGPATASFFLDGFVDHRGRMLACFARQRLRMHPEKLGNSTLMESIPLERVQGAREIMNRIVSATDYTGIFSSEFKYDERDRRYKIIEINVRPWWFVEFAARCGVDVCRLAYRDALGLPVSSVETYDVGRRCTFFPNDCRAYRTLRRTGTTSAWSWLKSWIGAQDALLELSDPMPFAAFVGETLKKRRARPGGAGIPIDLGHRGVAERITPSRTS